MSDALVSVVITAFNAAETIAETLVSALAQTHARREIIVVDDGSTDETAARLEPFGSAIRCVHQVNMGLGAARNRGVREARGDWLAFLDADDLWEPDALECQLAVARRHPQSALVVGDGAQFEGATILSPRLLVGPIARQVDRSPEGEIHGHFYRDLVRSFSICCPAQTLVPRRVVEEIGPVTEARNETPDYDYYLRIAHTHPITFHRRPIARWRYRRASLSGGWNRRPAVWAAQTLPILRRQLDLVGAGERRLVEQRIAALERELVGGASPLRLLGRGAWIAKYWIARLLPERLASPAIELGRSLQELLRRD